MAPALETDCEATIFIFQLRGIGAQELGKVPPVMDGVGRRDLAAGSVIETIHYRFHNSTIPRLHFRGDNYAERLAGRKG